MSKKRFTDIVCSETGHIGVTDRGIDKEFSSDEFEDFLNELNDENDILKQQLQTKYIVNKQYEELQRLKKENEQLRNYNRQLKERLERINGGYGHLTHRKGLTANEWLIESQEKEIQKKNEQISDWIEQHSKDVAKIGEQQATIEQLNLAIDDLLSHTSCDEIKKENEQLKERLYDFEKQKIIEESRIDEDVIPKIKLLRNELFGEKFERETI